LKKLILVVACCFFAAIYSCKKDDSRSCISCSSPQTTAFEVCEESDGTASVNGENTGTAFDVYVAGLQDAGANCGG
jgi:hypothetical protein